MGKLFTIQELPPQSEQASKIKQMLSTWSNRVPHHEYRNFGSKIEITKLTLRPCYSVVLKTQFDQRNIAVKKEPYKGEPLPKRKYQYPADVDLRSQNGLDNRDFRDAEGAFIIDGSQSVETCSTCGGRSKIRCDACGGQGSLTCPSCGGKAKSRCSNCNGSGSAMVPCGCQHGQVWDYNINRMVSCGTCGGKGQILSSCSSCGGHGTIACSKCGGSGKITCSTCNGQGSITCPTCNGYGKIKTYYEMRQQLRYDHDITTMYSSRIRQNFPEFQILSTDEGGLELLNITEPEVDVDVDSLTDFDLLHDKILEKKSAALQKTDQKTRIVFQNLQILQWNVYDVSYRFNGRDYDLLVQENGDRVFDKEGPIAQVMNGYLADARKAQSRRRPSHALKNVNLAAEMDLFGFFKEIHELQENLQETVMGHYYFGIWPAILLVSALYYFARLKIFQAPFLLLPAFQNLFDKFELLPKIHIHTISVLFVLIQLSYFAERSYHYLKDNVGPNIQSFLLRIFVGFSQALLFGLLFVVVMTLVEYSGLMLIPDFLVMYIYKAGAWLFQLIF